jgi:hypothetical protein
MCGRLAELNAGLRVIATALKACFISTRQYRANGAGINPCAGFSYRARGWLFHDEAINATRQLCRSTYSHANDKNQCYDSSSRKLFDHGETSTYLMLLAQVN